jgi:hypothetical protein
MNNTTAALSIDTARAQTERLALLPGYDATNPIFAEEVMKLFRELCTADVKSFRKPVAPNAQCVALVDLVLKRERRWAGLASLREAHRDLFPQYPDFE